MSRPRVSVIICAYTEARWDDLVTGIEMLRHQSVPVDEIIVAVDHNPRLLERVRAQTPGVVVVANSEPRGLSGARNSGVAVATGEVVAFLDDDAAPASDWLEHLTAAFEDPRVVGVGGSIEPAWAGLRPEWFPTEFDWVVGCTYRGMPQSPRPVRNLIGCNMSFRREVFETIGGFRTGIGRVGTRPMGCEETELCIRVSQRWPDRILMYEPRAGVRHRVPTSRARWRYFVARCFAEGLSKAQVARAVGARDGLASERTYTLRTLPRGAVRGLMDVAFRGDLAGLGRSSAIVAGLTVTTAGYLRGLIQEGLFPGAENRTVGGLSQRLPTQ